MSPLLIQATILINLALILYTIGVWAEKLQGRLKLWHIILFYLGLICDTLGTHAMSKIAGEWSFNLHSITGALAIVLMLIHALWATYVLRTKNEIQIKQFHKFSIIVWLIWLVPYFAGMFLGMM